MDWTAASGEEWRDGTRAVDVGSNVAWGALVQRQVLSAGPLQPADQLGDRVGRRAGTQVKVEVCGIVAGGDVQAGLQARPAHRHVAQLAVQLVGAEHSTVPRVPFSTPSR